MDMMVSYETECEWQQLKILLLNIFVFDKTFTLISIYWKVLFIDLIHNCYLTRYFLILIRIDRQIQNR